MLRRDHCNNTLRHSSSFVQRLSSDGCSVLVMKRGGGNLGKVLLVL